MAMETSYFNSDGTETVLAKVLTETSYGRSIYVRIPTFGKDRRTDGGAADMNTTSVEFEGDIYDYERGDYVHLTFEPKKYSDGHVLTHVEKSSFCEPRDAPGKKFPNTDIPKTCPSCGREACAVVESRYDSMAGGKVSDTADDCKISPDNRGQWFGFNGEMSFVHGTGD